MDLHAVLSLLLVFVGIPLLGVGAYTWLCIRMHRRGVPDPPSISYFVLFAHGGIWFLLLLTSSLWGWSGMSSLGVFYLLFVSPFVVGGSALALHDVRRDSGFHRTAYWLAVGYCLSIIALFGSWIIYCTVTQC